MKKSLCPMFYSALMAVPLLAAGCEDSYTVEPAAAGTSAPAPATPTEAGSNLGASKSTLGKARDAAVGVMEDVEARDADLGRMIDDSENDR